MDQDAQNPLVFATAISMPDGGIMTRGNVVVVDSHAKQPSVVSETPTGPIIFQKRVHLGKGAILCNANMAVVKQRVAKQPFVLPKPSTGGHMVFNEDVVLDGAIICNGNVTVYVDDSGE